MKYMLLIYGNEAGAASATKADQERIIGAFAAYTQALREAGVLLGSDRLQPTTTASTVRVSNGKNQVVDGPYAETKEQLGGYFMIETPDLDAALAWAARCPAASFGSIEVRPLWQM